MFLADMEDPCILGMHYFVSHRCELNLRAMQLTVGGRRVLLRTADKEGMLVTVKRTTVIPSRSKMLLPCEIKGTFPASLGLLDHASRCSTEHGVIVDSTLVDRAAGKFHVAIAIVAYSIMKLK